MCPNRSASGKKRRPASDDDESSEEGEEEGRESRESEFEDESDDDQEKHREKSPSRPRRSPPPPPPQKSRRGSSSARSECESEDGEAPSLKNSKSGPCTSSKQVEMDKIGHSKRAKRKAAASLETGEESKKLAFQRIWSEEDEIALLEAMIDYRKLKGMEPLTNVTAFYPHVKGLLGRDFTDGQLANKIRVFTKKYSRHKRKGKAGEFRVFSNPHEQKIFELSEKIWGVVESGDDAAGGREEIGVTDEKNTTHGAGKFVASPMSKSEALKSNDAREHVDDMLQMSRTGLDEEFLKKGLELLEDSKRAELKERWSKLQLAEMQAVAERGALITAHINLILEAYSRSTEN